MENKEKINAKIPGIDTGICVKSGVCGLCGGTCLMDLYLKDEKVIKVEGNQSLPFSNGKICAKGAALKQQLYHPDRLRYPMKRVGKRGEGKFKRISWKEALDEIAIKLEQTKKDYDANETMIYVGHPKWFRTQLEEFAVKYGTNNFGTESSTCAYALMMAFRCCFGILGFPIPDMSNCNTLLVWGVNGMYSNSAIMAQPFLDAAKRCKNLIVVDPRCTPTTECATVHLRPCPGTDGALALGLAYVMIEEELYDKEYVEKYTYGFEEYKNYVKEFNPERVEEITGVSKKEIINTAHLLTEDTPTALQMSAAPVVHNINGVQNARAILLLAALTGSFGKKGGIMPPSPMRASLKGEFLGVKKYKVNATKGLSHKQYPVWSKLIGETQVSHMADYLSGKGEYPIRNLIAFGMNHRMWPRPDLIEDSFKNLELFVNIDSFITETSKYADIILPTALSLEREQIEILGLDIIYDQPKVIEPEGEILNDMEILIELSKRLGFTLGDSSWQNYEDYLKEMLEPTGWTLDEVRQNSQGVKTKQPLTMVSSEQRLQMNTPSGKIEFFSNILEEFHREKYNPLPVYHDFRKQLPMDQYPMILATGSRKPQLFHSRTYRMSWLRNLELYAVIDMHPDDAEKLQLENDELVEIETPVGKMDLKVCIDSSNLRGMVNVYHGAGKKDINLLLDKEYLDPISGFPGYKSYCCVIRKKGEI